MVRWQLVLGGAAFGAAILGTACDGGSQTTQDPLLPTTPEDAGTTVGPTLGQDAAAAVVKIKPDNTSLDVTAPNQTQQFQVFVGESPTPIAATSVKWATDVNAIGTVKDGLFTATGTLGGVTRITATVGSQTVSTNFAVRVKLSENAAALDAATQAKLRAGGAADAKFRWLYPYDKTVFPRGLTSPTLQFAATGATDAFRVHVKSQYFEYEGFYKGTADRVDFPQAVWNEMTMTALANDPLVVDVTRTAGGAVTGPITESWPVAQGTLKGVVYYNSYDSKLGNPNPSAAAAGTTLRLKPGGTAEVFLGGQSDTCTVCHSVSANGTVMVTARTDPTHGGAFKIAKDKPAALARNAPDASLNFGALYPDGSVMMTLAGLPQSSVGWVPNVPGTYDGTSHLIDPLTGAGIPAPGWDGVVKRAQMAVYSPDGKRIAFNDLDRGAGHSLGYMDTTNGGKTYSGTVVDFANDPATYLGWPSFEPDSNWIVYGNYSAFQNNPANGGPDYGTWQGAKADLSISHLPSKTSAKLDAINGFVAGKTYLPYGDAETHLNYEPTILPEAVGGYYWVIFTSRRMYGNIATEADQNDSHRKKLWIAALDVETPEHPHTQAYDASHPAFVLPGQEIDAGNLRAFWALDACKQDSNSCATGDDCCSGFCREGSDGKLACAPPPPDCSPAGAVCTKDADCCSPGLQCLAGSCSVIR